MTNLHQPQPKPKSKRQQRKRARLASKMTPQQRAYYKPPSQRTQHEAVAHDNRLAQSADVPKVEREESQRGRKWPRTLASRAGTEAQRLFGEALDSVVPDERSDSPPPARPEDWIKESDAFVWTGRWHRGRRVRGSGYWMRNTCSPVAVIHQCEACRDQSSLDRVMRYCDDCVRAE
jgi:hypothetical protein